MKKKFLDYAVKILQSNKNYSDEQIEVILYGLEGIYLTITKIIILFALAFLLDCVKEFILLLIAFNIIRSQAFGIHANKSIYCLITSTIMFIGGALICKYCVFPFWMIVTVSVLCNICLLLYAPADTYKHPLVNKKKRKRFKYVSFSLGVIYTVFIIFLKDSILTNYLFIGMIEAVIMILPITYRTFKLPYNNYKTYNCGV